jgi:F5/8 type C domain-containing protein/WD40 repeat protein
MKKMISIAVVLVSGMAPHTTYADYVFGTPTDLGPTVNSSSTEWGPSISADGLSLYFGSWRGGGFGEEDIYVTTRATTSDPWGEAVNLGPTVNSPSWDQTPSISTDGLTLYFSSDRPGEGLWITTRQTKDDPWRTPVNLGPTVNSQGTNWMPSISADGLELYFCSDRSGGYGRWDIWVTKRETIHDGWGPPVNLGPTVNSAHRDLSISISHDGLLLFFDSDRPGGSGGHDLWLTRRETTDGPWGTPVNLGPTVNSSCPWDQTPSISADGSTLYFTSERPGDLGGGDIYEAPIMPMVDFNDDGQVDLDDLSIMFDNWYVNEPWCDIGPMPWGDGIVDCHDLMALAKYIPEIRDPRAKAVDVPCDATLSWIGSPLADTHDVYFGRSLEDVTNADRANPLDVLVSQGQNTALYDPSGLLEFGQTYYWRIDEVIATAEPTIERGVVWSFETELYTYPIDNIIATSNAISVDGKGPENTVNGAGLDGNDEHSMNNADMWLADFGDELVWIQYEFDQVYGLYEMMVWNCNDEFEPVLGMGLRDVTVEYSENGTEWTSLGNFEFAQATAEPTYSSNTTIDLGGVVARYVRLTVNSCWGTRAGLCGLSEVRFLHTPERAYESEALEN